MADVFSKKKRSQVMAAIRSKGNKGTELKLMAILRANRITGWRRHLEIPGKPDFVFRRERVAVFVDGCFWHGCRAHCRMPKSRAAFWRKKIARNHTRDLRVTRLLRRRGWSVLRFWEHALAHPGSALRKVRAKLTQRGRGSKSRSLGLQRVADRPPGSGRPSGRVEKGLLAERKAVERELRSRKAVRGRMA